MMMIVQRYTRTPLSLITFLFDLIQLLLAVRFILKFFGANAANGIVGFVYDLSFLMVSPFTGIFPNSRLSFGVVEWSAVLAMGFYAVLGLVFLHFLSVFDNDAEEVVTLK